MAKNLVGTDLGKYFLEAHLGKGNMGDVYRSVQPVTERNVAIKVIQSDYPEAIEQFKREAQAIAKLDHPNILKIYDFDTDDDKFFIIMEYIEGSTLEDELAKHYASTPTGMPTMPKPSLLTSSTSSQLELSAIISILDKHFSEEELRTLTVQLNVDYDNLSAMGKVNKARELVQYMDRHGRIGELLRHGQLSRPRADWSFLIGSDYPVLSDRPDDSLSEYFIDWSIPGIINIFCDLASAVDHAHQKGVIHRDLKPMNVMFASAGRVLLTDFGLAQMGLGSILESSDGISGTYFYMAPEQFEEQPVDSRSEIYSLGLILYKMLTNSHPFNAKDLGLYIQECLDGVPKRPSRFNPQIPEKIELIVLKALERIPDARYQSAAEMVEALRTTIPSLFAPPKPPPPIRLSEELFTVPKKTAYFVGREQELSELATKLVQAIGQNVLCLTGMGGMGKTTLAIHLAHLLRDHFIDGVLWADLKDGDVVTIMHTWANLYKQDFRSITDERNLASAVRNMFKDKYVLIILDDVWEIEKAKLLLPNNPECKVLITTRDRYTAISLGAIDKPMSALQPEESYQLLENILGTERVNREKNAAVEITNLLEHLPLALSIAASRLQMNPFDRLSDLADRLRHEDRRLQTLGLREDGAARTIFNLSWEGLSDNLRQIFATLGIFAGRPFSVAALAYIGDLDHYDAIDDLQKLVSHSLLMQVGSDRYRQHVLLADFAREKLGDDEGVYARMGHFYFDYARDHRNTYAHLEQEWSNLQAALQRAYKQRRWRQLVDFTDLLTGAWFGLGRFSEARHAYELAYQAAEKLDDQIMKATTLCRWGDAAVKQGDYDEAERHLSQSLHIFQELDDYLNIVNVQYALGRLYTSWGKYTQALEWLNLGLETLAKNTKNDKEELVAKTKLLAACCAALVYQYNFDEAEKVGQEALGLARTLGEREIEADILNYLGANASYRVEVAPIKDSLSVETYLKTALNYHQESLAIRDDLNRDNDKGQSLENIGTVYVYLGELEKAISYYKKALVIKEHTGDLHSTASVYGNMGIAYFRLDNLDEAEKAYQQALPLWEQLGHQEGMASVHLDWGDLCIAQKQFEKAYAHLKESAQRYETLGISVFLYDNYSLLAEVCAKLKRCQEAKVVLEKALLIAQQNSDNAREKAVGELKLKIDQECV